MPKEEKKSLPPAQYPEITRLLETEDFEKVNQDFTKAYESLEKVSKSKGLGKSSDAKRGMRAIERVMDLLRDLLRIKYQMGEKSGDNSRQGKK